MNVEHSVEERWIYLPKPDAQRRSEPGVLFLSDKLEKEEDELMTKLSFEYRTSYNRSLVDFLFDDGAIPSGNPGAPEYIINYVWMSCQTSEERIDVMRRLIKKIQLFKKRMTSTTKGEGDDDLDSFPENAQYLCIPHIHRGRLSLNRSRQRGQDSNANTLSPSRGESLQQSKDQILEEAKQRRLALKKQHFEIKNRTLNSKARRIGVLQSVHNLEQKQRSSNRAGRESVSTMPHQQGTVNELMKSNLMLPSQSKGGSFVMLGNHSRQNSLRKLPSIVLPSVNTSVLGVSLQPSQQKATVFDKYFLDLKQRLFSMVKEQKRTKHLKVGLTSGGLDLLCSQMNTANKVNKLSPLLWQSSEKGIAIREDGAVPSRNKNELQETRFDQKMSRFIEVNLPIVYKIRSESRFSPVKVNV